MVRLLLIEDNADLLANLYAFFEPLGYVLDSARDGVAGLRLAAHNDYDAIVLDLMLPRLDGLTLCHRLRHDHQCTTPILMLTARDQIQDRVLGFDKGADDYLIKPFSLAELEARIKALIRRAQGQHAADHVFWQDWSVDVRTPQAIHQGHTVPLTPIEHRLFLSLARAAPGLVTRRQLERDIWGEDPPDGSALRTHLHDLRKKLGRHSGEPLIETIHGVGFRLRAPSDPS